MNQLSFGRLAALAALAATALSTARCGTSVVEANSGATGSGSSSSTGSSGCVLETPATHRPVATACVTTTMGACKTSADCEMSSGLGVILKGTCTPAMLCSYDGCTTDATCDGNGGIVCVCASPNGPAANGCVPGNCHVDADCPGGADCSPTYDFTCGARYGVTGYYCHSCADACVNDSDCADGGAAGFCAYDPNTGHFACSYGVCSG